MTEDENKAKLFRLLAVGTLTAAAILFAFFGMDRSLFFDECCSIELAGSNPAGIVNNLVTKAHTPPLYYFLLTFWMKMFGTGEAGARSLSAIFYLASILAVYQLGKSLFDRQTAALGTFLFMVSPMIIQLGQYARMYSLLNLLGILSTLLFLRLFYLSNFSKKLWAAYVAVNIAGTFTHYWFFFILFAQIAAYVLLFSRARVPAFLLSLAASVFPFFALWTPVLLAQMTNGGTSEITRPTPYTLVNTLLIYFGEGKKAALVYGATLFLVLIDLRDRRVVFRSLESLKCFTRQKQILFLLLLAALPLLTPWAISQIYPIYVETRYPIIAVFAVALLMAAFLEKFANRFLLWTFCGLLFLSVTGAFVYRRTHPPSVSLQSLSNYVLHHARRQDILLFATKGRAGVDYYLNQAGADSAFVKFSFPAEMAQHPCWPNLNRWLNEKPALSDQADSLIWCLDTLVKAPQTKIWFFDGQLPQIDGILKSKLDANFQVLDERTLDDSYRFFSEKIRIYVKRNPVTPAANEQQ